MNPDQNQQPQEKKSFGATIGIIVIVIVLVLGALYFWGGQSASNTQPTSGPSVSSTTTIATSTVTK